MNQGKSLFIKIIVSPNIVLQSGLLNQLQKTKCHFTLTFSTTITWHTATYPSTWWSIGSCPSQSFCLKSSRLHMSRLHCRCRQTYLGFLATLWNAFICYHCDASCQEVYPFINLFYVDTKCLVIVRLPAPHWQPNDVRALWLVHTSWVLGPDWFSQCGRPCSYWFLTENKLTRTKTTLFNPNTNKLGTTPTVHHQ